MFPSPAFLVTARLACGILAIAAAGCHTHSPYGYGYPGSYPGVYQQPGMYGQPGTMVIPPGAAPGGIQAAPPYNPAVPVTPATPFPAGTNTQSQGADVTTDPLGQPESFPGSSSSQPQTAPDNGKLVPNYADPDLTTKPRRNPAVTPSDVSDPADFKGTINGAENAKERLKGLDTDAARSPGVSLIDSNADAIEFAAPVDRNAANSTGIQTVGHAESALGRTLSPYGRAANGQDWFRGLIDYDEQSKSWYLIYNPEPDASDKHGGTITLVEHPHLRLVQGDDVVLVEGRFDPAQTDQYGHPKYRVEIVRRLVP